MDNAAALMFADIKNFKRMLNLLSDIRLEMMKIFLDCRWRDAAGKAVCSDIPAMIL